MNRFILEDKDIKILGEKENNSLELNGGKGSGNWGHAGRPGEVGGSAPQGSQNPETTDESYESLRAEEDSLGYSLELESGSNIVKYVKENLGVVKTVEKYLDEVPEDMREQMARGMESIKKDLERVIESNKKKLGDDLTAENFEEKYEAYKESLQSKLDEVRAKIGGMRSEKRTLDLVTDSKAPDMDYIGSEKKRIDIARKSIGIFEDDGSLASDWLNGEIGEVKPEIRKAIEKDKELRQACLSQMYYDSNSKTDFKEWLKTPVTLRRVQFSDRINKDSGFLSFSQYGEWEGTGQGHNKTFPGDILEVKIKPQDTLGSIPTHEGYAYVEGEVMVPTELVVEALEKKQKNSLDKNVNGGKGSGNFGHYGRPGEVGGSSSSKILGAVPHYDGENLTFNNTQSVKQFRQLKDGIDHWTEEEKDHASVYFGSCYYMVNMRVRGVDSGYSEKLQESFDKTIRFLNERMDRSALSEDVMLYMGSSIYHYIEDDQLPQIGDTVSYGGFNSTSLDPYEAMGWGKDRKESTDPESKGSLLFAIKAKKGAKGFKRFNEVEREVLLPAGAKLKITGRHLARDVFAGEGYNTIDKLYVLECEYE